METKRIRNAFLSQLIAIKSRPSSKDEKLIFFVKRIIKYAKQLDFSNGFMLVSKCTLTILLLDSFSLAFDVSILT